MLHLKVLEILEMGLKYRDCHRSVVDTIKSSMPFFGAMAYHLMFLVRPHDQLQGRQQKH